MLTQKEYAEKFDTYVKPHSHKFVRVLLDDKTIEDTRSFVEKLVVEKAKEEHHQIDNDKEVKRFMTGILGEAAVEKLLGIKIRNWKEVGYSGLFNYPDIPGYKVGIKSCEFGKFPVVFKKNGYAQIICIRSLTNKNLFFVCGLANKEDLNKYQNDDLILSQKLRARGTKTGFYGFDALKEVHSLDDLSAYKK